MQQWTSYASEADVIGVSGDNEFCKLAWKKDNSLNQRHYNIFLQQTAV